LTDVILKARGLSFAYPGSDGKALSGIDFDIEEGEVVGFLGPNGSGKSTTQKLLTRILHGYEGTVTVFGRDLRQHTSRYYDEIGVSFELPTLYEKLTAEENLEFYRRFFDVPTEVPRAVLERLDLPTSDRRTVGQWSKGMKMRLVLARSLLNRPRLWYLDEPTTGQDPRHSVLIRELVRERSRAGTTVFLTTHDMTVADELCHRVAFLVEGRIVAMDSPRNLKLSRRRRVVRVELHEGASDRARRDFNLDDEKEKTEFLDLVRENDVETIHTLEPSLEDVFLEKTGRGLGEGS
jgi:fluoroquinolone transport system ATP-binding protein